MWREVWKPATGEKCLTSVHKPSPKARDRDSGDSVMPNNLHQALAIWNSISCLYLRLAVKLWFYISEPPSKSNGRLQQLCGAHFPQPLVHITCTVLTGFSLVHKISDYTQQSPSSLPVLYQTTATRGRKQLSHCVLGSESTPNQYRDTLFKLTLRWW